MSEWNELEARCRSCEKCELHKKRTNVVFGDGNKSSRILFVGEAPGEQEDLKGVPFVGRAGKLLDQFLEAVDLQRDKVYIANILKCRPEGNRDPSPEEQELCIGYLREQFALLKPKIIVSLGRISAMRLIRSDFKISKEHGMWFKKGEYLMTAVYHPAALLRDPRRKPETLEDFRAIREKAEELGLV
ncbi:MAG: uracil-DNA glycosylase family protein [Eubacteriales bacterium]